jgi:NCS1 family nucleobase:cation symporter-1
MIIMSSILLIVMLRKAGGFGPMLSAPSSFHSTHDFLRFFLPSLTAMVGYWATLSLNIPDFTRFAKNQEAQIVGQGFGLPVAMVLYSSLGIAVTSASTVVFGKPIWSPVELLGRFHQPLIAFLGLIALLVATLNVNIGANVVGPSNDFSNLAPRFISFRTGGLITGVLGLAIMPWRLVSSSHNYLGWLVDYSGLLGPVAGIMVADYFFVRRKRLDTYSLYRRGGLYEYRNGFNLVALIALGIGIAVALIGRFVSQFEFLFKMAWFVGFILSGGLYYVMMLGHKPQPAFEPVSAD